MLLYITKRDDRDVIVPPLPDKNRPYDAHRKLTHSIFKELAIVGSCHYQYTNNLRGFNSFLLKPPEVS